MQTDKSKEAVRLDAAFWNERYEKNETGWDLKQVSPPIKAYIDQLENKNISILIAGCGNAYEAEYLNNLGFENITLIDIAPLLVAELKEKFKQSSIKVLEQNIFDHTGKYDLILEQTLFCAIDPSDRSRYVEKIHSLLAEKGKFVGVLFNKIFEHQGPPFGGTKAAYEKLFSDYFQFNTIAPCHNSIAPRMGNELFINFSKK
ncbi:MAG: methyltransferase domain-containing protein [Chitinophagales bacterium]